MFSKILMGIKKRHLAKDALLLQICFKILKCDQIMPVLAWDPPYEAVHRSDLLIQAFRV